MKKSVFLISVIALCIGFAGINVFKVNIKDLRFLMTMSAETLVNY